VTGRRGEVPPSPSARHAATRRPRRAGARRATRVETRARARALQALYAWDVRQAAAERPVELLRVAGEVWDDLGIPAGERRVATRLVQAVAERGDTLDRELAEVMAHWRMERLGAIERSVLRLGAGEFAVGETPPRVVIQEAVRLAERYGSAVSAKFVNGVLDGLARRMGRL
jgi:transcription antitermination protein NusB